MRGLAELGGPVPCGSLAVPVTNSTMSHHFRVLREAGLIVQRCDGTRKLTGLRRQDLEDRYPGLLETILRAPVEPLAPDEWAPAVHGPGKVEDLNWEG